MDSSRVSLIPYNGSISPANVYSVFGPVILVQTIADGGTDGHFEVHQNRLTKESTLAGVETSVKLSCFTSIFRIYRRYLYTGKLIDNDTTCDQTNALKLARIYTLGELIADRTFQNLVVAQLVTLPLPDNALVIQELLCWNAQRISSTQARSERQP